MQNVLRRLKNLPPVIWVSGLFGLLIYLILPSQVVVLNDDFGYLRSVLETVQHGRPWTDDWLEPWSASLSVLSALIFKITGSFYAATCGLQAVFAGAAFGGIYTLLRDRGLSQSTAIVAGGVVLLCPTLLWKSLEYTGVALYLPCLLWAIWAAEKKRWGLFFIFWALAFGSRQSAVTWLAIPGCALLGSLFPCSAGKKIRGDLIGVLAGAIGVFAVLSLFMNKTHSQAVITDHLFERVEMVRAVRFLLIGAVVALGFSGIGAFLLSWRIKGLSISPVAPSRTVLILGAGVLAVMAMTDTQAVQLEHGSYEGWNGRTYIILLWTAGLAGWLISRFSLRWEMVLAAFFSLLLVCLRSDVWDYYYMDVAMFSLLGVVPKSASSSEETLRGWPMAASWSASALFAAINLMFVFGFKLSIDQRQALCVIGEKALRYQRIDVTEIEQMPFGFIGWHLHPHYIEHQGKNDPHIAGFTRYLKPNAIEVRMSRLRFWSDSKSLRPVVASPGSSVLSTEMFSVGWFWWQRCTILRHHGSGGTPTFPLEADRYKRRPFPLNDFEWRELASMPLQSAR